MPSSNYTEAVKQAYASAPSNLVILESIELSHPAIDSPYYLVSGRDTLDLRLEDDTVHTFEAIGFGLALPEVGTNGIQYLDLSLDNVDLRITDFINKAKTTNQPAIVKYRTYRSDDLNTPQNVPPLLLYLRDVSVTMFHATGKASFADLLNRKFPDDKYTRRRFVSLGS